MYEPVLTDIFPVLSQETKQGATVLIPPVLYLLPPNVSWVNAPVKLKSSAVVFPEDIAEATYSSKLPEIPELNISILNIFC